MSLLTQEYQRQRNQDIANRYIAGETLRQIGESYNMSRQTYRDWETDRKSVV